MYAVSGGNEEQEAVDEVVQETTASDNGEVAPESYKQAVLDPEWRKSMMCEGFAEQRILAGGSHPE